MVRNHVTMHLHYPSAHVTTDFQFLNSIMVVSRVEGKHATTTKTNHIRDSIATSFSFPLRRALRSACFELWIVTED